MTARIRSSDDGSTRLAIAELVTFLVLVKVDFPFERFKLFFGGGFGLRLRFAFVQDCQRFLEAVVTARVKGLRRFPLVRLIRRAGIS